MIKPSALEIKWREFRASLGDLAPAEVEFSGPRTRMGERRPTGATQRNNRRWPQLAGLTGRAYHTAYIRLQRQLDREA